MNKHFYLRMAANNLKTNRRFTYPFILTGIAAVAMFFIMCSISISPTLPGRGSMAALMALGMVIIAIFSLIFLTYTNSFLIKRRKKELGLYCVLGMEKRHLGRMLLCESILTALICITGGLLLGALLDRLMFLLLLKILHYEVTLTYSFSPMALFFTAALFAGIYLLLYVGNRIRISRTSPIALLHGGSEGEKEPKVKWVLAVAGVVCLAGGYYISITTQNALQALALFFVAVLLVILGTYCLFMAGSIAVLKLLKKRKGYYYKPNHFVSVSGMLYRMKQNAAGLASICVLSTMVLVTVSTTTSLYIGMNDILDTRYPNDIAIILTGFEPEETARVEEIVQEELTKSALTTTDYVAYESLQVAFGQLDGSALIDDRNSIEGGYEIAYAQFITADTLAALTGVQYTLGENQVVVYAGRNQLNDTFTLLGKTYTVVHQEKGFPTGGEYSAYVNNTYTIVLPDRETLLNICAWQQEAYELASSIITYKLQFNVNAGNDTILALNQRLRSRCVSEIMDKKTGGYSYNFECRQENLEEFYQLYGGFLFLGIFVGLLFLMATVLIIYYKQIIEGYEDRERFLILQKVGMDKKLIASSVHSQILTMFALPILTAAVHLCFAFPMLTRLLYVLSLSNVQLFAICTAVTLAVFAAIYLLVYLLTARTYYKIVSDTREAA